MYSSGSTLMNLIPSLVFPFHIIHKRFIHHTVSSWCWIVTGKIPVTKVGRTTIMKVFYGLINYFNWYFYFRRGYQLSNFCRDLLYCKCFIYLPYQVFSVQLVVSLQLFTLT